jgi:hypothetical protein
VRPPTEHRDGGHLGDRLDREAGQRHGRGDRGPHEHADREIRPEPVDEQMTNRENGTTTTDQTK